MGSYGHRMWALLLRAPPILVSLATGAVVALTVLGAGLGLIEFHGGRCRGGSMVSPVALITGLITALLTQLHVRELSRREARRLAGERMSHEVCNALQILVQCTYLQPDQREQLEAEAIERIRAAAREYCRTSLNIPTSARPTPPLSLVQDEGKRNPGKQVDAAAGLK